MMTLPARRAYLARALATDTGAFPARTARLRRLLAQTDAEMAGRTYCARCGTKLTDPASVTAGLGPECARKAVAS